MRGFIRVKLIVGAVVILVMAILLLWFPNHAHDAAVQSIVDRADRDVAAAKAAASAAAESAAKARGAAQDAQNHLPGSS